MQRESARSAFGSWMLLFFNSAAPIKRTAVERQVNLQIVFLFILLLALSVGSTIGSSIRTWFFSSHQWYLFEATSLTGRGEPFPRTASYL